MWWSDYSIRLSVHRRSLVMSYPIKRYGSGCVASRLRTKTRERTRSTLSSQQNIGIRTERNGHASYSWKRAAQLQDEKQHGHQDNARHSCCHRQQDRRSVVTIHMPSVADSSEPEHYPGGESAGNTSRLRASRRLESGETTMRNQKRPLSASNSRISTKALSRRIHRLRFEQSSYQPLRSDKLEHAY